jgi:hypothetical protein
MSEMRLENSFSKLLGRQATDKERQNLYRARDAFGLKDNDAFWLQYMIHEFQKGEYTTLIGELKTTTDKILEKHRDTSKIIANAANEEAKFELAKAIGIASHKIAHDVATTNKSRWVAICATVSILALATVGGGAGYGGYTAGYKSGSADGYQHAQEQKAAAAWANTEEGQIAYAFAQTDDLKMFAECSGAGWQIKNGVCYAYPSARGFQGWKMPTHPAPPPD